MDQAVSRREDRSAYGLGDADAQYIADIIHSETGVCLSLAKKTMIQARLLRRMQKLGLARFEDYIDFLRRAPERLAERSALVDILTTHKTDFFRERHHFEFLTSSALASLSRPRAGRPWQVWSAGCSSGEEAWSLAMVLAEHFGEQDWRFHVLATDVSSMVLAKARQAVYPRAIIEHIAPAYQSCFLMTGRGRQTGNVRVVPELRERVTFRQENLLDPEAGGDQMFDLVFCRNVMIYFDRDTTAQLVRRLAKRVLGGGYLFIGHSETVEQAEALGLRSVAPTVYQKV